MNVCYREKEQILYTPLKEFRKLAKSPKVNLDTIVFNNLVVDKAEYESIWEVPTMTVGMPVSLNKLSDALPLFNTLVERFIFCSND